jgi:hypothetical protein
VVSFTLLPLYTQYSVDKRLGTRLIIVVPAVIATIVVVLITAVIVIIIRYSHSHPETTAHSGDEKLADSHCKAVDSHYESGG